MAQTWRVTMPKRIAFSVIDALGYPLKLLLSRPRAPAIEIRRILVMEPWHIGDVVLATPLLRALRAMYPKAHITLVGQLHAEELLRHSGLTDETIIFEFPWTAKDDKYSPKRYRWRSFRALVKTLRDGRFDLSIDARMDIRSNLVTFASGAPRRIGYKFGGGAFLLTDALPATPDRFHKVEDWLDLLAPLLGDSTEAKASRTDLAGRFPPRLVVTEQEASWADRLLRSHGVGEGDAVIGIHMGASDARRRWPPESFASVANALRKRHSASVLVFAEPGAEHGSLPIESAISVKTSIREMMALMTRCRLLLCNDSGPMHIADALEVPLVAVFLTGNPVWHRPFRATQAVVGRGTGHDFLELPSEADVLGAAEAQLARPPAAAALGIPAEEVTPLRAAR